MRQPPARALAHAQRLVAPGESALDRLRLPGLGLSGASNRRRNQLTNGCRGDRGGEPVGRLQRREVTGVGQVLPPDVGEELVQAVAPGRREQRVVLGPQHGRRHLDPGLGRRRALGQARRDRTGARAIPADRGGERSRGAVQAGEPVQLDGIRREGRARPVRPEVLEIGADRRAVAVEQPLGQLQPVKRLIPELGLRLGREHSIADARQRRRQHQRADSIWAPSAPAAGRCGCRRHSRPRPAVPAPAPRSARARSRPAPPRRTGPGRSQPGRSRRCSPRRAGPGRSQPGRSRRCSPRRAGPRRGRPGRTRRNRADPARPL